MPKVLPQYLEQRRQQILDAAAACFSRRGFHQTTMQHICEEAELSPGALYRYFASKEDIIEAMCARGHGDDVQLIRETMSSGATQDVLRALVRHFFLELENMESCVLSIELLGEARRNAFIQDSLRDGSESIRRPLAEIVRSAQQAGEINPGLDADAVARVMMAIYQGLLHQKMLDPTIDVGAYGDTVMALFEGRFWQGAKTG